MLYHVQYIIENAMIRKNLCFYIDKFIFIMFVTMFDLCELVVINFGIAKLEYDVYKIKTHVVRR